MIRIQHFLALMGIALFISGCQTKPQQLKKTKTPEVVRLSFAKIKGIKFYEVHRRFNNGLSFNKMGFQQEPSWIMQFASDDSVRVYSPTRHKMQGFHVLYDHGDVYNFAGEWFRIKEIYGDSVHMQRLKLTGQVIEHDMRSDVHMTFYSENYIRNILKTSPEQLMRPSAADTAFIRTLVQRSAEKPGDTASAFAGTQPVAFQPLSKLISVEKLNVVDKLAGKSEAYNYLYPEYRIVIQKAYQDFAYGFTCVVDEKGKIYLNTFRNDMPEYREKRKKVLEGIISVYLQNLLKVTPASTLGIPHSSEITLNVVGKM